MSESCALINKDVQSYMKYNKEFCYVVWMIMKNDSLLDIYFEKYLYGIGDFTIKSSGISCFINNELSVFYRKDFSPKSHNERHGEILNLLSSIYNVMMLRYNDYYNVSSMYGYFDFIRFVYLSMSDCKRFSWLTPKDKDWCLWTYNYLLKAGIVAESKFYDAEEIILYCTVGFKLWNASSEEKEIRYKKLILSRNERRYRKNKSKN